MTQIHGTIPKENLPLITQLFEKLGGEIKEVKNLEKTNGKSIKKIKEAKVPLDYLFGKWPDFDIDPRELRKQSWSRKKW